MPVVNPEILRWARETAGLSLDDAASKIALGPARGMAGSDRLAAFERGDAVPTRALLIRMAKQYRRPLLTFYLSAAPERGERGQDFRALPQEYSRRDAALVDTVIRDVRARQGMVRALMEAEDEAVALPFVASKTMREGVEAVASAIAQVIGFDLGRFRNGIPGDRQAATGFAYLRQRTEKAGIYVLLIGNLGSWHSNLDLELFRGFALADPVAPFVVINDQDADVAWSFTLLHELAHIWLGQTGVSGSDVMSAVEQFCNDVASHILLPSRELDLEGNLRSMPFEALADRIGEIADRRRVSRSLIAYKLYRHGMIDRQNWKRLNSLFRQQWLQWRKVPRNGDREGGPDYYVVRRHRLGTNLVDLARRMLLDGSLAPSKAARILGVKPSHVYTLLTDESTRPPRAA
jgi:Zn-dependent peptidase ImmA (M78 family)